MNKEKENKTPSIKGISYFEGLSLILFTLKLLGIINCSWWIVFLPILFDWIIVLIVIGILLLISGGIWLGGKDKWN